MQLPLRMQVCPLQLDALVVCPYADGVDIEVSESVTQSEQTIAAAEMKLVNLFIFSPFH